MDSNNQKMYPPIDAQQPVHPSQMQQPQGFQGYPPMQQQGYPAAPPNYDGSPNMIHHQQPVITQQPTTIIVQTTRLGPDSQMMTCPSCRATISTSVKYEPATKTHLFAGLICLVGCWAGCCLIPYCVDSCQSATHTCPNCGTFVGRSD